MPILEIRPELCNAMHNLVTVAWSNSEIDTKIVVAFVEYHLGPGRK